MTHTSSYNKISILPTAEDVEEETEKSHPKSRQKIYEADTWKEDTDFLNDTHRAQHVHDSSGLTKSVNLICEYTKKLAEQIRKDSNVKKNAYDRKWWWDRENFQSHTLWKFERFKFVLSKISDRQFDRCSSERIVKHREQGFDFCKDAWVWKDWENKYIIKKDTDKLEEIKNDLEYIIRQIDLHLESS